MTLGASLSALPGATGSEVQVWIDALPEPARDAVVQAKSSLGPLFTLSPYLFDLAEKNSDWLISTLGANADATLTELFAELADAGLALSDEEALSRALRKAKGRLALLSAIAETGGVWTPAQTTSSLADLADHALEACLDFSMKRAAAKGQLTLSVDDARAANSGLAIFALGKQGGRELNYSSDIDIVAFYDAEAGVLSDPLEANKFYTRMIRQMVSLMEDRVHGGYVFRTDLRLRPDPGSTPVAISVDAALAYYEARGQNWERAAWIKARACAGDKTVASAFLRDMAPFVWRRHLDFAAISDIQAMKRQINIARKVGKARVEGHNVKLGRGGIREIEFFTQTQQLIAGGRDPELRVRPTCDSLAALAHAGWITPEAAKELTETYWYLRAVENRLQMVRDEQTHTMPDTPEGVADIALLMGEADVAVFEEKYRAALSTVMRYYAELFIEGETLASDIGDLVFTGTDDDPATLETLQNLGFSDPVKASTIIRKWHYGSYPATRASAARGHLTELTPSLLTTISATGNADEALARFDHFLSRFPAGVQLFSLLRNNTQLSRLLVAFMASAPRLAEAVISRAHVMDGLIDPAFADGVTNTDTLVGKVDDFLGQARSFEDLIDRARIIGQEQKFLISAGFVSGTVDAARAGVQFSALAQTLLQRLFVATQEEFAHRHGHVPGASAALLGFGKLASREMTFTSDLDFILLYDVPEGVDESDGEKPLAPTHYFSRLTQRLVAALSAPTAEGVLYEADMRLRPSGNAGPLATSLNGFTIYQMDSAWTWEHMALSRARVIAGGDEIAGRIDAAIRRALAQPRHRAKVVSDVISMRERIARERKPRHPFDLKLLSGGLVDIEFVAQSAQLMFGEKIDAPRAPVAQILERLGETGLLTDAPVLLDAFTLYSTVLQAMSIGLTDPFKETSWTPAFKELLAELTHLPDFARLESAVQSATEDVQRISADWYAFAEKD